MPPAKWTPAFAGVTIGEMSARKAAQSRDRSSTLLPGADVAHGVVAAEEVEEIAQSGAARAGEAGILRHDAAGVGLRHGEQLLMRGEVGEAQLRHAALLDPEGLAAAYAESGDYDAAVTWQSKAIELLTDEEEKEDFRTRLELYREKKPYHTASP